MKTQNLIDRLGEIAIENFIDPRRGAFNLAVDVARTGISDATAPTRDNTVYIGGQTLTLQSYNVMVECIIAGHKIKAIKVLRAEIGLNLKDSKDFVESHHFSWAYRIANSIRLNEDYRSPAVG